MYYVCASAFRADVFVREATPFFGHFFPLLGGSPSQVLPLGRGLEDCSRGLFGTGILVYLNASVSWFDGLVIVWLKGFTLFLYCVFDLLVVANEGSE